MKIVLTTVCIATLLFSSAIPASQNRYFYLSANAGFFHGEFDNRFLDNTDTIPQNVEQPADQHGYTGGIALGFRRILNPVFFMGSELSANLEGHYATYQSGAATAAFSDKTQIRNHSDLTLVPGLMLNDTTAAYLKLGLSYASLRDQLASPAGFTPVTVYVNSSKNVLGLAAAIGVEKKVSERVSVFAEVDYHDYGNVNFPGFQNFTASYSHRSHIYSGDLVVGASCRLGA